MHAIGFFWQFSRNNTHIGIAGKYVRSLFACMVSLQSMCKSPCHCWNFMESGSESATYAIVLVTKFKSQVYDFFLNVFFFFIPGGGFKCYVIKSKKV